MLLDYVEISKQSKSDTIIAIMASVFGVLTYFPYLHTLCRQHGPLPRDDRLARRDRILLG